MDALQYCFFETIVEADFSIPDDPPICGGTNGCDLVNQLLEKDDLILLKDDVGELIQIKKDKLLELKNSFIKQYTTVLNEVCELEIKLETLERTRNINELNSSINKRFFL